MRTLLCLLFSVPLWAEQALTNADIVRMVEEKKPAEEIFQAIQSSPPQFHLTPGDMDAMMAAGVTEDMIRAMAGRMAAPEPPPVTPEQAKTDDAKWNRGWGWAREEADMSFWNLFSILTPPRLTLVAMPNHLRHRHRRREPARTSNADSPASPAKTSNTDSPARSRRR